MGVRHPDAAAAGAARRWAGLAGWLVACFAAAAVGGVASARAAGFYAALDRPPWAPPAWLFGPVWTLLYVLMAVAAWLAWREGGWAGRARMGLRLFVLQLALNALWTWLFFVWRRGALALVEVVVLLLVVVLTALAFARVHRVAAALLLPYVAWLALAAALTAEVWRRNPTLL